MSDFLSVLDQEIADLEEALRADPRHQKLAALKELRALYTRTPSDVDVSQAAARKPPTQRAKSTRRRGDPERQKILDHVDLLLTFSDQPGPIRTAAIYSDLIENGFEIGGRDPKSNLSAMLFNSGRFQSHGRQGWTRKAPEPQGRTWEEILG